MLTPSTAALLCGLALAPALAAPEQAPADAEIIKTLQEAYEPA